MPGTAPLLRAGPPASPPGIILFLIPVLLVVVVARVLLKLAWKPTVVTSHCQSYGYEYHPGHVREAGRQR